MENASTQPRRGIKDVIKGNVKVLEMDMDIWKTFWLTAVLHGITDVISFNKNDWSTLL